MADTLLHVTYQVAGAPVDNNVFTKEVTIGSTDVRLPEDSAALTFGSIVEVWSHSWQQWCPGRVEDNCDGVVTVFFLYPDMSHESEPIMKKLPVGHDDIRLPLSESNTLGLVVGSPVELYSNSLAQWLAGRVHELKDGGVVVGFMYPEMGPTDGVAIKELPFGHQDLRLPSYSPGEAGYLLGVAIEVYSHSRQFWCPGIVDAVGESMITCAIRYPDLTEDTDPAIKVLPVGDPDLRLAGDIGKSSEFGQIALGQAAHNGNDSLDIEDAESRVGILLSVRRRASELAQSGVAAAQNRHVQITCASATTGGVVLGTGGGVAGLATGAITGAAVGVIPALFTFGLSIPLGAMIGGTAGLCVGTAVGGTTGVVAGGTVGYGAYAKRLEIASVVNGCTSRPAHVIEKTPGVHSLLEADKTPEKTPENRVNKVGLK